MLHHAKYFLQARLAAVATRYSAREVNKQIYGRHWSWMEQSMTNLSALGFQPTLVLDIGSANGEFYKLARKVFPHSQIRLFEARREAIPGLQSTISSDTKAELTCEVLSSPNTKEVTFYRQGVGSSVYRNLRKQDYGIPETRYTRTLDGCLENKAVGNRIFLKADVQGYELEILDGSKETLEHSEVLLLECSLIQLNEGCPVLNEVLLYVGELGFIPYDICSFFRGGPNSRLRQIDMIFLRSDSLLQSLL